MSLMTDARLRLLEQRVAEIERRLTESGASPADTCSAEPVSSRAQSARAVAPKPRKRSKKTP
jgi:hypothetical protein